MTNIKSMAYFLKFYSTKFKKKKNKKQKTKNSNNNNNNNISQQAK